MVATSVAVFDLDDDAVLRIIRSDSDAVLNLLGGTWLEGDIRESISGELVQQFLCFIQLRDTRGNGDAGKSRAVSACLWHNASLTELQVPQVAVEEHGVKCCGATWLQKLHHAVFIDGKSFIGVLSAAGHL